MNRELLYVAKFFLLRNKLNGKFAVMPAAPSLASACLVFHCRTDAKQYRRQIIRKCYRREWEIVEVTQRRLEAEAKKHGDRFTLFVKRNSDRSGRYAVVSLRHEFFRRKAENN